MFRKPRRRMPPLLSVPESSFSAGSGSGKNSSAQTERTLSKEWGLNGSSWNLARTRGNPAPLVREAYASISSSSSRPTALIPRRRSSSKYTPMPHPASRTSSPGLKPVREKSASLSSRWHNAPKGLLYQPSYDAGSIFIENLCEEHELLRLPEAFEAEVIAYLLPGPLHAHRAEDGRSFYYIARPDNGYANI